MGIVFTAIDGALTAGTLSARRVLFLWMSTAIGGGFALGRGGAALMVLEALFDAPIELSFEHQAGTWT